MLRYRGSDHFDNIRRYIVNPFKDIHLDLSSRRNRNLSKKYLKNLDKVQEIIMGDAFQSPDIPGVTTGFDLNNETFNEVKASFHIRNFNDLRDLD